MDHIEKHGSTKKRKQRLKITNEKISISERGKVRNADEAPSIVSSRQKKKFKLRVKKGSAH